MTNASDPAFPNKDDLGDGPEGLTKRELFALELTKSIVMGRYASGELELINVPYAKVMADGIAMADALIADLSK